MHSACVMWNLESIVRVAGCVVLLELKEKYHEVSTSCDSPHKPWPNFHLLALGEAKQKKAVCQLSSAQMAKRRLSACSSKLVQWVHRAAVKLEIRRNCRAATTVESKAIDTAWQGLSFQLSRRCGQLRGALSGNGMPLSSSLKSENIVKIDQNCTPGVKMVTKKLQKSLGQQGRIFFCRARQRRADASGSHHFSGCQEKGSPRCATRLMGFNSTMGGWGFGAGNLS